MQIAELEKNIILPIAKPIFMGYNGSVPTGKCDTPMPFSFEDNRSRFADREQPKISLIFDLPCLLVGGGNCRSRSHAAEVYVQEIIYPFLVGKMLHPNYSKELWVLQLGKTQNLGYGLIHRVQNFEHI